MPKATKPPLFEMSGGPFRVKPGVPFKLLCCDYGLGHAVIINVSKKGKVTVGMFRDEDTTDFDRATRPAEQWEELRAECNARLKALRRKGK